MKKMAMILLITFMSSVASASCVESYNSASKPTFELKDSDGSYSNLYGGAAGSTFIDVFSAVGGGYTVPVFTTIGVSILISVSVETWLRGDMTKIGSILKQARSGGFSSEMDDLLQFTENYIGESISSSELEAAIIALDNSNAFCTNELQDYEDFKYGIANKVKQLIRKK